MALSQNSYIFSSDMCCNDHDNPRMASLSSNKVRSCLSTACTAVTLVVHDDMLHSDPMVFNCWLKWAALS